MSIGPYASSETSRDERMPERHSVRVYLWLLNFGPLLILLSLLVLVSIVTPVFMTPGNIYNIVAQTAVIATVAIGQHLVILTRGIDLSVGSNLALATVIGALTFRATGDTTLVVLAMLLSGAAVGAVNGIVYVYGRLPHPFIITLATLSICRGLALEFSVGHTTMRGMPEGIGLLGQPSGLGVPNAFFVVAGTVALALVMTRGTVWGRWLYAVGGSPQAAVSMGIPVKGVLVSAYVVAGLSAGIGAVLLAGRTGAGSPLYGDLLELDTIAAVIIGGASFLGGRGHIGNALIGAVMIGVIRNALNLNNVDVFFQMIAIGVVIVVAVEADVLRGRLEAKMRVFQATRGG